VSSQTRMCTSDRCSCELATWSALSCAASRPKTPKSPHQCRKLSQQPELRPLVRSTLGAIFGIMCGKQLFWRFATCLTPWLDQSANRGVSHRFIAHSWGASTNGLSSRPVWNDNHRADYIVTRPSSRAMAGTARSGRQLFGIARSGLHDLGAGLTGGGVNNCYRSAASAGAIRPTMPVETIIACIAIRMIQSLPRCGPQLLRPCLLHPAPLSATRGTRT
jgi:hypothetical protein